MECPNCYEEVDRVLEPPIVCIPRSFLPSFEDDDEQIDWHVPGQGYPGKETFMVLRFDDESIFVRHWETSDQPICYRCWAGHVWPALQNYLDNKPKQLKLNGWKDPVWIESDTAP